MALHRTDEIELLAELHEGERQQPRWRGFLGHLQRRCAADEAALVFCNGEPTKAARGAHWRASRARGEGARAALPWAGLDIDRLRLGRVYAFSELSRHATLSADAVHPSTDANGRVMRIADEGAWSAWLIVSKDAGDLSAADSALLSALAPHIAIAMRNLAAIEHERTRASIQEEALKKLGVAWRAHDGAGKTLTQGGAPWPTAGAASGGDPALARLAVRLAGEPSPAPVLLRAEGAVRVDYLVAPLSGAGLAAPGSASLTTMTRLAAPIPAEHGLYLAHMYNLSTSEARLAIAIANGASLAEAAQTANLTIETARNYSKRIYAKTGARGLAELVRLVLTSVVTLA